MQNFNFGYACVNNTLKKQKIFPTRTCRLATLIEKGQDYVKDLALKNLNDLLVILKWNKENEIFFMRLSSDMFPFASHHEHGYGLDFADQILKKIGDYAKENNMRLTMHPGQYNVLSSPDERIISNTTRDLNYHCDILDRMGLGKDSVMIVHGGGLHGNKQEALERLSKNILLLPENTRNRLVLENCETSYCVEDLLPVSEKLKIPIVIDFHHDDLKNSPQPVENYFSRVFKVWNDRGIKPKVHVSNSCDGVAESDSLTKRRKHSDYISFLHKSLLSIEFHIDVMFEAKMKELSIIKFNNNLAK